MSKKNLTFVPLLGKAIIADVFFFHNVAMKGGDFTEEVQSPLKSLLALRTEPAEGISELSAYLGSHGQ